MRSRAISCRWQGGLTFHFSSAMQAGFKVLTSFLYGTPREHVMWGSRVEERKRKRERKV